MTNHTLITFLGRGLPHLDAGYRPATYHFPDDSERLTPFFGLALADYLAPDSLVVLGTAGSMWGVLLENHVEANEEEALRLEVMEAEIAGTVDQDLVDRIGEVLARALGSRVSAHLIPFARDVDEQIDILETMAAETGSSRRVSLDLTHGFRHLGMIGFLSAFMLEGIERLEVDGLWYGALDMTRDGTTPVLRLDGLHAVHAWVTALERFDASGDYGIFAPLLEADGLPADKADCLRRAAFFEATMNIPDAVRQLQTLLPELERPLADASELFRRRLLDRLQWARRGPLSSQQRRLAILALERGDYQRSATLGYEALVTRACEDDHEDALDQRTRQAIAEQLRENSRSERLPDRRSQAFRTLNQLRNALAHGTPPNYRPLQNVMKNPDRLTRTLREALDHLGN